MKYRKVSCVKLWLLLAAVPLLSFGQAKDPCADLQLERDWATSPVYIEAEDLAQRLRPAGIQVQCIRRAKEDHLFDDQAGAAWFKTDQGAFVVWFLPETETFNSLQVIEHSRGNGRFVYSFGGTPEIKTTFDSSKRIWFIKQRNVLFEVRGDSKLAARIRRVLGN
jgi:hypothetical protein